MGARQHFDEETFMRQNRFIVTSLTVAALVLAVACRSSRTTKTSSTTSTTSVTTTPVVASSSTVAPTVYTDNNGTINTGELGTSIRHENGWGVGFNAYVTPNVSTEFTASRIRPTATLAPTNATFNPITDFRIRMTPITGAVQFHFLPHAGIDPY